MLLDLTLFLDDQEVTMTKNTFAKPSTGALTVLLFEEGRLGHHNKCPRHSEHPILTPTLGFSVD